MPEWRDREELSRQQVALVDDKRGRALVTNSSVIEEYVNADIVIGRDFKQLKPMK